MLSTRLVLRQAFWGPIALLGDEISPQSSVLRTNCVDRRTLVFLLRMGSHDPLVLLDHDHDF